MYAFWIIGLCVKSFTKRLELQALLFFRSSTQRGGGGGMHINARNGCGQGVLQEKRIFPLILATCFGKGKGMWLKGDGGGGGEVGDSSTRTRGFAYYATGSSGKY